MKLLVIDRYSYSITHREVMDNGYLKVPGRVARSGIQEYLASELGLMDREPNEIIKVFRPPEEVFNPDSLKSYDNADVTDDHPGDMVDSKSFKDVSVGHSISEGRQDSDFVVVDLLIKDKKAIEAVDKGKVELSAGYEAEYIPEKGTTKDGESYDFVQRNIRINHIALVDRARAGREARLFDKQPKENTMKVVTLDDGSTIEVADAASAKLIQSTIDRLKKQAKDAETKSETLQKSLDEETAKKEKMEEDMEEEKKKSSEDAIAARVKEVSDTKALATKIAGDKFTCDSVNLLEIKREALKQVRPTVDWDKKSESYVQVAWDMEAEKDEEEREEEKGKKTSDALSKDLENLYMADGQPVGDAAYNKFLNGGAE